MLVVGLTAVCPLGVVLIVNAFDARLEPRLSKNVAEAAARTADALEKGAGIDETVLKLSKRHHVRIRAVIEGKVLADENRDPATGIEGLISTASFGPDGAPTLAAYDAQRPPLGRRPIVVHATALPKVECSTSAERRLLVCDAAVRTSSGVVVVAQESTRRAIRALYDVRYQLTKLILVTLPLVALLAWWLGWRMIRPVERLRRQVLAKVDSADTTADLDASRGDEFGDLAGAFNTLLDRLKTRDAANEAFLQDLVHEAKSPVAAIRAAAESLGYGRPIDDARAARLAAVLENASHRLNVVVTEVLELARAEAGLQGEVRTEVDLVALCQGVVSSTALDERFCDVEFKVLTADDSTSANVACVGGRVEAAIRNLVVNAASFAATDDTRASVSIVVTTRAEDVEVDVVDNGPGIDPQTISKVFDRFFTQRDQADGDGIGLAMVKAVAEAHGGSVGVSSTIGEGARFRLRLPRTA